MKVGIVGAGFVGSTAAYALVMRGVGREIVLVDRNRERAAAEADDIRHAVPFAHPLQIDDGDFPELAGCRVVVLCAGVPSATKTRYHLIPPLRLAAIHHCSHQGSDHETPQSLRVVLLRRVYGGAAGAVVQRLRSGTGGRHA